MKKLVLFLSVIFILPTLLSAQDAKFTYIGAQKCKICHRKPDQGEQFGIWEKSQHAKAYETLKSEQSQKIAKERGLKVAANEAPECLKCHVTAYDQPAEMKDKKFAVEDGVQCESCHGPGSEYKSKKIMEDRELSIKNGLNPILVSDGSAEKQCKTCHNEESPTFKGFEFAKMWEKIKHPVPAEK